MNATVIAETVRRHVTHGAYIAFLMFLALVALGVSRFNSPAALWPSLIWIISMVVGAGLIGPELSSGRLQLILVKPVDRSVYLLSRYAGVIAVVWLAVAVAFVFEGAGRLLLWDEPVRWERLFSAVTNSAAAALLSCALLALFGSLTRAYMNVAIYFLLMVGLSITLTITGAIRMMGGRLGRFFEEYAVIEQAIMAIEMNLFPDEPPRFDGNWLLRIGANTAVALVLACLAFRRREIPYGTE